MLSKDKKYVKIPNFFNNSSELFNKIGGKDSFVLYCMLISRKNALSETYTSISEILYYLNYGLNKTREGHKILDYLILQKNNNLIDFDFEKDDIKNTSFFKITFPCFENSGRYVDLVNFYEDDFLIYENIGTISYCTMWLLRMLKNNNTDITSISISEMSKIISCKNIMIQHTVYLFSYTKLFEVVGKNDYYDSDFNKKTSITNEYKYLSNIDNIMQLSHEDIQKILISGNLQSTKSYKRKIDVIFDGCDCFNNHGIYFIYDDKDNVAYIGKSSSCIVKRSLRSVEERMLYDFRRIELKPTKTQSDVEIYEKYYIQKYKPQYNLDGIYDDNSTLQLPDLPTKQMLHNKLE